MVDFNDACKIIEKKGPMMINGQIYENCEITAVNMVGTSAKFTVESKIVDEDRNIVRYFTLDGDNYFGVLGPRAIQILTPKNYKTKWGFLTELKFRDIKLSPDRLEEEARTMTNKEPVNIVDKIPNNRRQARDVMNKAYNFDSDKKARSMNSDKTLKDIYKDMYKKNEKAINRSINNKVENNLKDKKYKLSDRSFEDFWNDYKSINNEKTSTNKTSDSLTEAITNTLKQREEFEKMFTESKDEETRKQNILEDLINILDDCDCENCPVSNKCENAKEMKEEETKKKGVKVSPTPVKKSSFNKTSSKSSSTNKTNKKDNESGIEIHFIYDDDCDGDCRNCKECSEKSSSSNEDIDIKLLVNLLNFFSPFSE